MTKRDLLKDLKGLHAEIHRKNIELKVQKELELLDDEYKVVQALEYQNHLFPIKLDDTSKIHCRRLYESKTFSFLQQGGDRS